MIGNREAITELLLNIQKTMHEKEIEFFLLHGTLLGYYRDKNIIPWDDDVDLGCLLHSDEKYEVPKMILNIFENEKYVTSGYIKKTTEWAGACNVVFCTNIPDVVPKQGNLSNSVLTFAFKFVRRIADRAIKASSPVTHPWNDIKPLVQIKFLNEKFHIPAKPEELFDKWYGKDCWKVPSRRAWIIKPRDKANNPEPIVMYENQKMGYRATGVIEALLECDKDGKYIEPYVYTGKTPRR